MTERPGAVVVRHSAGYHVFLWTVLPLLGVLAGWTLSRVPDWVDGLSWIPFQGPIELLDQVTGRVGTIVLLAVGALVGAVVALTAYDEIIRVEIDPSASRSAAATMSRWSSAHRWVECFTDGKDLVLTGPTGAEVARKTSDLEAEEVRAGVHGHGISLARRRSVRGTLHPMGERHARPSCGG
ncbi:hypothetical protein [Aeromicrobium sp. UC242_57]|uniref:YqeB family protein n=1 Tax=Aeromicrobium sp. UC242_57 TaxID=3374624 RepID=UPI0037A44786